MTVKKSRPVQVSILVGCARCGRDHKNLTFTPFTRVVHFLAPVATHFCMCPKTKQPILMHIVPPKTGL